MTTAVPTRLGVADLTFYQRLAHLMNSHPEWYRVLGDADKVAVFTVTGSGPATDQAGADDHAATAGVANFQLVFEAMACEAVDQVSNAEAALADFRLVGPATAWSAMFDDIVANGQASGEWTINSLALRGDRIRCLGDDPMGVDKFSRFNQTLQQFLDGAGRLEPPELEPPELAARGATPSDTTRSTS